MSFVVIYTIKNKVTNQTYVGSAKNYKTRWSNHINQLRRGTHPNIKLQNSWKKYGEQNFEFEVIEFVENEILLIEREQYYLDNILGANSNDNTFHQIGFNILRVAGSSLGFRHTEESKEKIRGENNGMFGKPNPFFGKNHSEESKQLMSRKLKGRSSKDRNHFWKKTHSSESIEKMKNSLKKFGSENPIFGKASPNRKIVIQYSVDREFIKEWSYAGEAANSLGINTQNISSCCLGKMKTYKGFIWEYKEDYDLIEETKNQEIRTLYQQTNITQRELSKLYKMSPNKVSKILKDIEILS